MRTTITIDDGLLADAKRAADAAGKTLSALVEEALRDRLAAPPTPGGSPPFRLITLGGDGLRPGVSWEAIGEVGAGEELQGLFVHEP